MCQKPKKTAETSYHCRKNSLTKELNQHPSYFSSLGSNNNNSLMNKSRNMDLKRPIAQLLKAFGHNQTCHYLYVPNGMTMNELLISESHKIIQSPFNFTTFGGRQETKEAVERRRKVKFAEKSRRKKVEQWTKEERDSVWYTSKELKCIRQECRTVAESAAKAAALMSALSDNCVHDYKAHDVRETKHDVRGLELFHHHGRKAQKRVAKDIKAVLKEQQRLRLKGKDDPDGLARVCHESSTHRHKVAHLTALSDAQEIYGESPRSKSPINENNNNNNIDHDCYNNYEFDDASEMEDFREPVSCCGIMSIM